MEPYQRQHELPGASAIAQHCSPATFFLLRQEKFGVLFKNIITYLSYSLYIA
jgi:hypothetical protein